MSAHNNVNPAARQVERIPPEIPDRAGVIAISKSDRCTGISKESFVQAKLTDESGFAKNVLNNPEEDCWNDL